MVNCIIYTDASDGKVPSVIYTDYINLEVKLKTEYQSVGEKEKQIEIKSTGKNLINLDSLLSVYENNDTTNKKLEYIKDGIRMHGKSHFYTVINVKPNTDYTFSSTTNSENIWLWIGSSNEEKGNIKKTHGELHSCTFNSGNNTQLYISFVMWEADTVYETISNIQFEEGTKATPYESYKEDKTTIKLKEPLRGLPNGIRDAINTDGTITRRVGEINLNEIANKFYVQTNEENGWKQYDNSLVFAYHNFEKEYSAKHNSEICSNAYVGEIVTPNCEGITYNYGTEFSYLALRIKKSKLSTPNEEGLKKYLKENPVTLYYELKEPVTENIGQPLNLKAFKGGQIVVDTDIAPYTTVDYPSNVSSRLATLENAEKNLKDSLGGAWRTLLALADSNLKHQSNFNNFGGRNYVSNSNFMYGKDNWYTHKTETTFKEDSAVIKNINENMCGIYQVVKDIGIKSAQKYTLSFYAKADKDLNVLCGWTSHGVNCRVKQSSNYIRYSILIGSPLQDDKDTIIVYNETQNSTVEITRIQVECGDVVTDWKLAPEDSNILLSKVNAIEKTLK